MEINDKKRYFSLDRNYNNVLVYKFSPFTKLNPYLNKILSIHITYRKFNTLEYCFYNIFYLTTQIGC